jgi:hypothetical protein
MRKGIHESFSLICLNTFLFYESCGSRIGSGVSAHTAPAWQQSNASTAAWSNAAETC